MKNVKAEMQIVDINWKKSEYFYPAVTLYNQFTDEKATLNLLNHKLNFMLSENRYCSGNFLKGIWHSCTKNNGQSVVLRNNESQCLMCDKTEGFKDAVFFGKIPNENAKEYLEQDHFLYLTYFAPDIIKVGTASNIRKDIRLIEQDALVYAFIAKTDGYNILKLEHHISKNFNVPEAVSTRHKYKFLSQKPTLENAEFRIKNLFKSIKHFYKNTEFEKFLEKDNIKIVNLSFTANIFFPQKIDLYLSNVNYLSGNFLGLRGKILLLSNYDNIIALNKKRIIGKRIIGTSQNCYDIVSTQNNGQLTIF